jgi:hypothetical protein
MDFESENYILENNDDLGLVYTLTLIDSPVVMDSTTHTLPNLPNSRVAP